MKLQLQKGGLRITRKRVTGWINGETCTYGAMGSKRRGDEAAVLVLNTGQGIQAVVYCVRYSDGDPQKNPYLHWAIQQAYKFNTQVHWYSADERSGRHTARLMVFADNPDAKAEIFDRAYTLASEGNPWARTFANFGRAG